METLLKEQILKQARIIEDYQDNESDILGAEKGGKFHGFIAGAEWAIEKLKADKAELLEALEIFFPMFTELDSEFGIENPHPRKWTETEIATVQKLFDLIQKTKQ